MNHKPRLFLLTVILPQQILGIIALWYLWYSQEYQWLLATFISWFFCYAVGEGVFLHRYHTHRAFECRYPLLPKIFSILTILGGHANPIAFKAIHIAHHSLADSDQDPHSPNRSFFHGWIWWYWSFKFNESDWRRFSLISKHLTNDKFYIFLFKHGFAIWWASLLMLTLIDFRLALFTMGLAGAIGVNLTNMSNSFGHCEKLGRRRFDTNDNSTNLILLSWIFWNGAGTLHNNHHKFPTRHHDSHAWYEFDISKWVVPLVAVKNKK